jgi:hypothetical protein
MIGRLAWRPSVRPLLDERDGYARADYGNVTTYNPWADAKVPPSPDGALLML